MRKFILFVLTIVTFNRVYAQYPAHSINENFDVACASGTQTSFPTGWIRYTQYTPIDSMQWHCTATLGRNLTPGMRCVGYHDGAYHLDTAWLFTPALSLSDFPDSAFLRYDSKYEVGYTAGTHRYGLATYMMFTLDTTWVTPVMSDSNADVTSTLAPVIGPGDSSGWVTHELNLTPYKSFPTIRVAFRYVSTNTDAGAWTLDNINTSPFHLSVSGPQLVANSLNIAVADAGESLQLFYNAPETGNYFVRLWDMNGRLMTSDAIYLNAGEGKYNMPTGPVLPGIYSLELWNAQYHAITKVARY